MKKILFGITSLTIGGAERVLVDMVNNLYNDYKITIFTIYANGDLEKGVSEEVNMVSLYDKSYKEFSKFKKICISLKLFFRGKNIYNKLIKDNNYDKEVAFLEGPITRLFKNKSNAKKIAWVHNDITKVFGNTYKAKFKKSFDNKVYKKYDNIIFVSKDNLENFKKSYKDIQTDKLKLIYNYIDAKNVMQKANEDIDIKFDNEYLNFLTVARLVEQKAIDRLIDVHIKLIKDGFIHNFYVIGEGPQRKKLENMIKENHMEDTFKLLGKINNPYPYINKADVFCLASYYEGYGMVIEEAKILDKHILITNTAAREAIKNYNKGNIVENTKDGIYEAIKEIIQNKQRYKTKINTQYAYDNSNIIEQIKELFEENKI